jgi:5'-3' exonuclease
MGILEFFGTFTRSDITASSIISNYANKSNVSHLLLDFNSIIHVASKYVLDKVNAYFKLLLANNNSDNKYDRSIDTLGKFFNHEFDQTKTYTDDEIIKLFHKKFSNKEIEKLIITRVIEAVHNILDTYCDDQLKTLLIAIDGVPSKGKMIEQRQRRHVAAVTELYKKKLLGKYKKTLIDDKKYAYHKYKIKWSKNNITPGTGFMHLLCRYLREDKNVRELFISGRKNMNIIISDMYEVGEGEIKIVNYIDNILTKSKEKIYFYSPDADVILLSMLSSATNLFMLKHNQQISTDTEDIYDLVDITKLKNNISGYVNKSLKTKFPANNICNDIVCISTIFGNDFLPRIETMNVKKGFGIILDVYTDVLSELNDNLVINNDDGIFTLNYNFLAQIFKALVKYENEFINANDLNRKYIYAQQLLYVFGSHYEVNIENITEIYMNFTREYGNLKSAIKTNNETATFISDDIFMALLKKAIIIEIDGKIMPTKNISNNELISLIKLFYKKTKNFPRLDINLNNWSSSTLDKRHVQQMKKDKIIDPYDIENYKFDNMLDEYHVKFNAGKLDLAPDKIKNYYEKYFHCDTTDANGNITTDGIAIVDSYVEGLVWVFNQYFNDKIYISNWYYLHERAPLINLMVKYFDIKGDTLANEMSIIMESISTKLKLTDYFNPLEQLIYVSPMTDDILKLLPEEYEKYIESKKNKFLNTYFIDIEQITDKLWSEKKSTDIDCESIPYFNKCLLAPVYRPDNETDITFLKNIRKIKKSATAIRRSACNYPKF